MEGRGDKTPTIPRSNLWFSAFLPALTEWREKGKGEEGGKALDKNVCYSSPLVRCLGELSCVLRNRVKEGEVDPWHFSLIGLRLVHVNTSCLTSFCYLYPYFTLFCLLSAASLSYVPSALHSCAFSVFFLFFVLLLHFFSCFVYQYSISSSSSSSTLFPPLLPYSLTPSPSLTFPPPPLPPLSPSLSQPYPPQPSPPSSPSLSTFFSVPLLPPPFSLPQGVGWQKYSFSQSLRCSFGGGDSL